MVHVAEIVGHESSTDQIVLNNAFKWDPVSDQYIFSGRSRLFEKITKRFGTSPEKIKQDIEDRKIFLKWLMTKNIRDYKDVSQQIRDFYSDKEAVIERALRELDRSQHDDNQQSPPRHQDRKGGQEAGRIQAGPTGGRPTTSSTPTWSRSTSASRPLEDTGEEAPESG